jgi:outer membrane immunogenic protein
MQKIRTQLLATAALVALTGTAFAADMGIPAKAPYAPPPPPVPTWTGFYVGANLGGGFGDKWWTIDQLSPALLGLASGLVSDGQNLGTTSMDGFLGGVQAGYNWQTGLWVFGIEGTFDWTDMHGQFPITAPLVGTIANASSKLQWIATAVGRVGVTVDRALIYAGGGAAWAHEKDSVSLNPGAVALLTGGGTENFAVNDASNTPFGWTFLTGIEYKIDPAWSARIQYNFYDFRSKDIDFTFVDPTIAAEFGTQTVSTQLRIHSVTAGVNYKFWGW